MPPEPLSAIFGTSSWSTGFVSVDWKREMLSLSTKSGERIELWARQYEIDTHKILEQMIKQFCEHLENNILLVRSQHRFIENKLCLNNLIFFFDRDQFSCQQECDGYCDFSKAVDKASQGI